MSDNQDILLILITTLCFLIIFSLIYLCCLVSRKIRNQDITVSLAQPGKLKKFRNNFYISLSLPQPPQPPPSQSETPYENLTDGEPSALLPPPAGSATPPPSQFSEKEEEKTFIQSVEDQEKEERNEERIRHLQVTCEVLKERMVKVERELRKLKK